MAKKEVESMAHFTYSGKVHIILGELDNRSVTLFSEPSTTTTAEVKTAVQERCQNCRWWGPYEKYPPEVGYHYCGRIKLLSGAMDLAFLYLCDCAKDGLATRADFGCILWSAKEHG